MKTSSIPGRSEAQVTTWTFNLHLNQGHREQSYKTESLACEI